MSTFSGKIAEIPGISVDRFDGENLYSEVFFLSHCHTDHMIGINTLDFEKKLLKHDTYIYVSPITKVILTNLYPYLEKRIKELDFNSPTPIYLKDRCVSVIPIPSGHCPGSVMFLFEENKTVLYTGDYRMKLEDIKKIKAFYDSYGKFKSIHKLYLDTTFFSQDYMEFPLREESLDQIIGLIKDWIILEENNIIHLVLSAKYGYEYVIMEIFDKIKMPIHVNQDAFNFYTMIPHLDGAVTLNGELTKIHCNCGFSYNKMCCKSKTQYNVRSIRMSAMRWKNSDLEEGITIRENECYSVCYSTHASFTESVELIKSLKPSAIHPCVLRKDEDSNNKIFNKIDELLSDNNEPISKKPKLFDVKKISNNDSSRDPEEAEDIFDEAFDSPPEVQHTELI